jgi:acyl dehydratase
MGVPITELQSRVGEEVGASDWFTVDQARIDAFADATLDHQYIHVDPERAAETPWGTTIAHGYLTLSLLPHLMSGVRLAPENTVMAINYGSDKIRFLQAVPVGSEIRARVTLADVTDKGEGRYLVRTTVTVDIKGEERPALIAETLSLFFVA